MGGRMLRGEYRLCLGSDSIHVYRSLEAEAKTRGPGKGRVEVGFEEGCIVIIVESNSISGLRALTNSYLLLAHSAYSAIRHSRREQGG